MATSSARNTLLRPIHDVARDLGLDDGDVIPYGRDKAKVDLSVLDKARRGKGKLILVSATNPTPAGEGKTTMSIGLAMGLRQLGRNAVCALREPSLGPVFGLKGGGTGGGRAQIQPATDINLHFTGDIHAITSANNLLAAMVDNELHFAGPTQLDPRRITWRRALDMNDRALRRIIVGLGGPLEGLPREAGFNITAASEVMAIVCMARSFDDLHQRLGQIVVGQNLKGDVDTALDLGADTAMAALLKDAILPNLAQTDEGGPAFVHGGPFANIAHGCSSILGTRLALHLADDVVTEAGFGCDLGAEKFLHIKCRAAEMWPDCMVIVTTLRALRFHGGQLAASINEPDEAALIRGLENLEKHLETANHFGIPPVVAINRFAADIAAELDIVQRFCERRGTPVMSSNAFEAGGAGALDLARVVADIVDGAAQPKSPRYLYNLSDSYERKLNAIATQVYGADGVDITPRAARELARYERSGYADLPICVAKTHLSLSDDAKKQGRPENFRVTVSEVRLSAGAGFVVALLGDLSTMPGLPRHPTAKNVHMSAERQILGLMQSE